MMRRRLASIVLILLALLLGWQAWVARAAQNPGLDAELKVADGKIRSMVMTQDLGYLRRQALDLHKAFWNLRKEQARQAEQQMWLLGACGVLLFGIGAWQLLQRRPQPSANPRSNT